MSNKKQTCNTFSLLFPFRSFLIVLFLFIVSSSLLPALDFFLRPQAFAFFPMGKGNQTADGFDRYDTGGGADIGFELDISTIWPNPFGIGYFAGFEGGIASNSMKRGDPTSLLIYSLGGSFGLYYFPLSRLFTRVNGTLGFYVPTLDKFNGPTGFYWRAGGEAGFRFTPSIILAANVGWRQYQDANHGDRPFNSGLSAGLTAQITLETGKSAYSSKGAEGIFLQADPVYPAFLQLYQRNPVGTVVVRNRENAEIRNVRLSFRAANYTSSEFFCGSAANIPRGREVELPLLADFSPAILRFTDEGRILGELVIRYNFLGQERTAVSTITVETHNRNTITGDDTSALAAFISPTSPETLEYSKFVAGLARSKRRTGHNQNMQFAIWLFEGMRASGLRMGETYNRQNEVQFPAETLAFGTGSSRDLALLFAATLESVGISSAFIKVGTDYIVAVNLAMGQAAAETLFNSTDRILNIDDDIWLPIAMSSFNDGFMASWTRAAVSLNQAFEREESLDFVMAKEAWAAYPPAPLPELGDRIGRTNSEAIIAEADLAFDQYISQDILPLLWKVETQISKAPTAALYNRFGILLARSGRIAEARHNYERAAGMGSVAAMTNRASLALTEREYDTAEYWFRQALERDSGNSTALRGLERVEGRR